MGRQTITHTCGHERTYSLFGKHVDRDRKAKWLAEQDCPRCENAAAGPQVLVRHAPEFYEIAITNCYEERDTLACRGYSFSRELMVYNGIDLRKMVGQNPLPGWSIRIADADRICEEIDWIEQQGWHIELQDQFRTALESVVQGRPSLALPAARVLKIGIKPEHPID